MHGKSVGTQQPQRNAGGRRKSLHLVYHNVNNLKKTLISKIKWKHKYASEKMEKRKKISIHRDRCFKHSVEFLLQHLSDSYPANQNLSRAFVAPFSAL